MTARPARVLFVTQSLGPGGATRVLLSTLRGLDRAKVTPTLYLMEEQVAYPEALPPDVRVKAGARQLDWKKADRSLPGQLAAVAPLAAGADVVVAASEKYPTYLAYLAATLARRPLVACVHIALDAYLGRSRPRHRTAARWIYPRSSQVVCVSQGVARGLAQVLGEKSCKARVIYNPLEVDTIQERAAQPLPDWADYALAQPTIVGVGRFTEQKGFDLLIRAHAALLKQGIKQHLLILGDGPQRDELQELVLRLQVEQSVFMPGFLENPYPLMQRASVFALPSRFEGFGMVLAEAMVLGVPTVAADCPSGPAELLDNGRCGRLIPPENVEALTQALAGVLGDPGGQQRTVQLAREAVQRFTPSEAMAAWHQVLDRAAA